MRYYFLILAMLTSGCQGGVRPGWQTFDARGRFRFDLPIEVKFAGGKGLDSYVRKFAGPSISVSFDLGKYSTSYWGPTPEKQDYRVVKDTIDGFEVTLISWFHHWHLEDSLPYKLSMNMEMDREILGLMIQCKTANDTVTAHEILNSVRIERDHRKRKDEDGWVQ